MIELLQMQHIYLCSLSTPNIVDSIAVSGEQNVIGAKVRADLLLFNKSVVF